MSNFEFPPEAPPSEKPQPAWTDMKVKCLIIDIEKKLDKNHKDYWIIRTKLDKDTRKDYLAFGTDYNINQKTLSMLMNYPHLLVNSWAVITIRKQNDKEKVIAIEKKEQD